MRVLHEIVSHRLARLAEGIIEADDIRIFVKDEPHSVQKIRTGRLRLIMVMSLEDQVVDRYLMSNWSSAERDFFSIPGKTGWSPLPLGYRYFETTFDGDTLATDFSSFDWTLPPWVPELILDARIAQCKSPSARYITQLRSRFAAVLRDAVIRMPNGTRYRQQGWGLMKSGWFRTIAFNSSAVCALYLLAWKRSGQPGPLPDLWTMGDDAILAWPPDGVVEHLESALSSTGVLVKHSSRVKEFAGFRFGSGRVTPIYTEKHLYALRYVAPDVKQAVATCYTCLYALAQPSVAEAILPYVEPHSSVPFGAAEIWAHTGMDLGVISGV